jgi:two-component system KDP operon response regulator KdpE
MTKKQSVLIIDDEKQIRKILQINLEANGYMVYESETGSEGLVRAVNNQPSAVLLDLGLPDGDGLTILNKLREWYKNPVIILSVRKDEKDIIKALDSGANDYLTKPFSPGELLARLRVAFRSNKESESSSTFKNGNLSVDLASRTILKNQEPVKLTSTEYNLLWLFIQNPGKVITHKYILERIWGNDFEKETQYLRVYIGQLRKKIEDDPGNPQMILTESGIGYRFQLTE